MVTSKGEIVSLDKAKISSLKTIGGVEIVLASDLPEWGMSIAIYGPPGVGKTTFCAQAIDSPYGAPVLDLDAEGGARSIAHTNVEIVTVDSWAKIRRVASSLTALSKPDIPWKSIIIDNMSEYQSISIKSIAGPGNAPQLQHWGQSTSDLLKLTRDLRDWGRDNQVNIFFIAWESPEKDESTGIIKHDVGFTPSLARQFPGIVDIVGYLSVTSGDTRSLTFAPSRTTASKFRRSLTEAARRMPLTFSYKLEDKPVVDILNTLRGGGEWPTEKYARRQPVSEPTQATGNN